MTSSTAASPASRPDLAAAIAHLESGAPRPDDSDPIGTMRAFVRRYGELTPRQPLEGVEVTPVADAGFEGEWIVAAGCETSRRLVYLHGGGWVAGDLESHRPIAVVLAKLTGWAVLLVDYRLAPEHPFPAGLDDCAAALRWARANGPGGPSAARATALGGDSAGGNLAAAVCLGVSPDDRPDRLVLICAALDGTVVASEASGGVVPDAAGLAAMMQLYTQNHAALDNPAISPLLASDASLAAMPPTLLQVSSSEYLFSHSYRMATQLMAANVRTVLSSWPDMPHVWHAFLDLLPEAPAALAEVARFIRAD